MKRKGKFFWIGFQGSNADSFWKIIEPYVLDSFASSTVQESGGIGSDVSQDSDTDHEYVTGEVMEKVKNEGSVCSEVVYIG